MDDLTDICYIAAMNAKKPVKNAAKKKIAKKIDKKKKCKK